MSALSGDVTKRTVAMHAEDFFTKPLDFVRLERRIADLLHPIRRWIHCANSSG